MRTHLIIGRVIQVREGLTDLINVIYTSLIITGDRRKNQCLQDKCRGFKKRMLKIFEFKDQSH